MNWKKNNSKKDVDKPNVTTQSDAFQEMFLGKNGTGVDFIQHALAKEMKKSEDLTTQLVRAEEKNAAVDTLNRKLRTDISEKQAAVEEKNNAIEEKDAAIKDLEAKIKSIIDNHETAVKEKNDAITKANQNVASLKAAAKESKELSAERLRTESLEIEKREENTKQLEERITTNSKKLEQVTSEKKKVSVDLKNAHASNKALQENIDVLTQNFKQEEIKLTSIRKKLADEKIAANLAKKSLSDTIEKLKVDVNNKIEQLSQIETEYQETKTKLADEQIIHNETKSELNDSKRSHSLLHTDWEDLVMKFSREKTGLTEDLNNAKLAFSEKGQELQEAIDNHQKEKTIWQNEQVKDNELFQEAVKKHVRELQEAIDKHKQEKTIWQNEQVKNNEVFQEAVKKHEREKNELTQDLNDVKLLAKNGNLIGYESKYSGPGCDYDEKKLDLFTDATIKKFQEFNGKLDTPHLFPIIPTENVANSPYSDAKTIRIVVDHIKEERAYIDQIYIKPTLSISFVNHAIRKLDDFSLFLKFMKFVQEYAFNRERFTLSLNDLKKLAEDNSKNETPDDNQVTEGRSLASKEDTNEKKKKGNTGVENVSADSDSESDLNGKRKREDAATDDTCSPRSRQLPEKKKNKKKTPSNSDDENHNDDETFIDLISSSSSMSSMEEKETGNDEYKNNTTETTKMPFSPISRRHSNRNTNPLPKSKPRYKSKIGKSWNELTEEEKKMARELGYKSKQKWNSCAYVYTFSLAWDKLNLEQQEAGKYLFGREFWSTEKVEERVSKR